MNIIKSIEIAYFRSIYKEKLDNLTDMTILFGRNDAGKSNFLRALNLFFNEETNPNRAFHFQSDFNNSRLEEAESSSSARKFSYVKITFNTPENWKKSLGKTFYVKKSWSISRGSEPKLDTSIDSKNKQFLTRFLNQIKFHYIPAIKDRTIFENLLGQVYNILSANDDFSNSLTSFTEEINKNTTILTQGILKELGIASVIAPPDDLTDLFRSLDFETTDDQGAPYSLTLQRGDGIQVRHIPQILKFLSDHSSQDFHLWGFEEPENSLELANACKEAEVLLSLAKSTNKQLFITSHSPAFFSLEEPEVKRYYINRETHSKSSEKTSIAQSITTKQEFLPSELMGESALLPLISSYLKKAQSKIANMERDILSLKGEILEGAKPLLFVEGCSDKIILEKAWSIFITDEMPFDIIDSSGTTKMQSLSQDGKILHHIGNNRAIFVIVDNDKEGRELSKRSKSAIQGYNYWKRNNSNLSHWCCLPCTKDFITFMESCNLSRNAWPFTIENCFTNAIHKEAMSANVITFQNVPHDELIDETSTRRIAIERSKDDDYTYLRAPDGTTKIAFAEWLANLPEERNDLFLPFKDFLLELNELVKIQQAQ